MTSAFAIDQVSPALSLSSTLSSRRCRLVRCTVDREATRGVVESLCRVKGSFPPLLCPVSLLLRCRLWACLFIIFCFAVQTTKNVAILGIFGVTLSDCARVSCPACDDLPFTGLLIHTCDALAFFFWTSRVFSSRTTSVRYPGTFCETD